MRISLYLLTVVLCVCCTTTKDITIIEANLFSPEIVSGDKVNVKTTNGKYFTFEVVTVTEKYLIGDDIKLSITEIVQLEKVVPSKSKTMIVIGTGTLLAILVVLLDGAYLGGH